MRIEPYHIRYSGVVLITIVAFCATYFMIYEEYRNPIVSIGCALFFGVLYWLVTITPKQEPQTQQPIQKDVITDKPSKKQRSMFLEVGELYILMGNEKSNLSLARFVGYQQFNENSNDMEIFEDIITKEKTFALCAKLRYTDVRFKALSKLTFTEVIELTYYREFEYTWSSACTTDFNYIDPMLNYDKYTKAI